MSAPRADNVTTCRASADPTVDPTRGRRTTVQRPRHPPRALTRQAHRWPSGFHRRESVRCGSVSLPTTVIASDGKPRWLANTNNFSGGGPAVEGQPKITTSVPATTPGVALGEKAGIGSRPRAPEATPCQATNPRHAGRWRRRAVAVHDPV